MSPKILIVDDEPGIVTVVKNYFEMTGYQVLTAGNGTDAMKQLTKTPDLVLLDINMPDIDGLTVCRKIREHITCPILFLTARIEISDKVQGFLAGADDYIVKPFDMLELMVRMEKVLERTKKLSDVIRILDVEINFLEHSVRKNGEEVLLKPMEFELLCVLARNKNIAISRAELLRRVWGMDYLGETRTVDVHIGQLRKKLSLNDNIKTVSKMGYRLED